MLPLSPCGETADAVIPEVMSSTRSILPEPSSKAPEEPEVNVLADSKLLDKLSDVAMVQDAAALR